MNLIERLARKAASSEPVSRRELARTGSTRVLPDNAGGLELLARALADARVSRRRALAAGGATLLGLALRPSRALAVSCPSGTVACNESYEPCCLLSEGVVCVEEKFCCKPGKKACLGNPPYGMCCEPSDPCYVDAQGFPSCKPPCPSAQVCGSKCCASGEFCCDSSRGLCCTTEAACCTVGASAGSAGTQACCSPGQECIKEILPGEIGVTAASPTVCCPPERTVTATGTHLCCPPGSAPQPSGGLSTRGGLCCTEAGLCGKDCCDSTPSFPMNCVHGHCQFKVAHLAGHTATASDGAVPIPVSFGGAANGTIAIEAASGGASAQALQSSASHKVLGTATLRSKRKGRRVVKVRLNDKGRKQLRHHKSLPVNVVITFKDHGTTLRSSAAFKIKAPHH